jgi:hypothetical protein
VCVFHTTLVVFLHAVLDGNLDVLGANLFNTDIINYLISFKRMLGDLGSAVN